MDIKTIIERCIRIFYISKKPTNQEYWEVAKVTSLGMIGIGVAGLIISFVLNLNLGV